MKCGLCAGPQVFLKPYVPPEWTGEYLLVVDYAYEGLAAGLPFTGLVGKELQSMCKEAGLARHQVAVYAALRCRPELRGSAKPKITSLRNCAPYLHRVIYLTKPTYVIAMGEAAAKAFANDAHPDKTVKLRGRVQTLTITPAVGGPLVVQWWATYSPESVALGNVSMRPRVVEDLARHTWPILPPPLKEKPKGDIVGIDSEFTPGTGAKGVLYFAVSDVERVIGVEPADYKTALPALVDKRTVVGQNISVDLESLLRAGVKCTWMSLWLQGKRQRDSVLTARLGDESRGKDGYRLESLLLSYYQTDSWKLSTDNLGTDPLKWPPYLLRERCRLDAWATLKVQEAAAPKALGPAPLCHAIAMTLRRMYHTGVYIDAPTVRRMKKAVVKSMGESEKATREWLHELANSDVEVDVSMDIGKDSAIRSLLYDQDKLNIPVTRLTKGKLPSIDAKTLKLLQEDIPAVEHLLRYNKFKKLNSTYCDSLTEKFQEQPDGRWWMPVRVNPLATKTGRRASDKPNLQNWPVPVRRIIVSRFVGGVIADNDFSKLEPVLGGWVMGEERLSDYFTQHENGYIKIGEDFFKKSVDKVSDEYRAIKALVLAIIYNQKKWSLAENLWILHKVRLDSDYKEHERLAGEMLEKFLTKLFPGIKKYQQRQEDFVLENGYVDNAVGQRRRLPVPPEPDRRDKQAYRKWCRFKSHVVNQSINYPIQSLASYVTGSAMVDLERRLLEEYKLTYEEYHWRLMCKKWPVMPLLAIEVHDDLVFDIPGKLAKKTIPVIHEVMTSVPSLRAILSDLNVTLKVDTHMGPSWGLKS
jgi:uracil-DNA glycosylase family 4